MAAARLSTGMSTRRVDRLRESRAVGSRSIAEFRKQHLQALAGLFVQVLRLCQEAGLVRLGHVAIDGTKVKANASKHKAMSYERMAEAENKLEEQVAANEAWCRSRPLRGGAPSAPATPGASLGRPASHRTHRLQRPWHTGQGLGPRATDSGMGTRTGWGSGSLSFCPTHT